MPPFEAEPVHTSELAHRQARLGSAREVVKRFSRRTGELDQLIGVLHGLEGAPETGTVFARRAAFQEYQANLHSFLGFYREVFSPSAAPQEFEPVQMTEERLGQALERYSGLLDPAPESALDAALHLLRVEWSAARRVGGLQSREVFAAELAVLTEQMEELRSRVEEIAAVRDEIDGSSRDGAAIVEDHVTSIATRLEEVHAFLESERAYWQSLADDIRDELVIMKETQGGIGTRSAEAVVAAQRRHFNGVLAVVDSVVDTQRTVVSEQRPVSTGDPLTAIAPHGGIGEVGDAAVPFGPAESSTKRLTEELTLLAELAAAAEVIEREGKAWLDELEAGVAAEEARLLAGGSSLTTSETFYLDSIAADQEFGVSTDNLHRLYIKDNRPVSMFVVPHPDDETTKMAKTIAWHHEQGYRVVLVTMTDGAAGSILNPALDVPANHRNFVDIRNAEQLDAGAILGADVLERAGFGDSGMEDDPSLHPNALVAPGNKQRATAYVRELVAHYRPEMVFTMQYVEEQSAYRHPDHSLTHEVTCAAVLDLHAEAARDRSEFTPPKLYAVTLAEEELAALHCETPSRARATANEPPSLVVDTNATHARRATAAQRAYQSQIPPDAPILASEPYAGEHYRLVPTEPVVTTDVTAELPASTVEQSRSYAGRSLADTFVATL